MIINLLNEQFVNRSQDNNATRLLNWYLEIENPNVQAAYDTGGLQSQHGKYKIIAIPTPGKTLFNGDLGSSVRGAIAIRGIPYFVVDNIFYSYASDGSRTNHGTLNTSSGKVTLATFGDQIGIVDGTNYYNFIISTNSFATITTNVPANPIAIAAQDGFFLITGANSIEVHGSAISDGTTWSALSYLNKQGAGDYVTALISNQRFIWVLGERTSEVWYNNGAATFSFTPYPNVFLEYGCSARNSVTKGDNGIFFLAVSTSGGIQVVMSEGLQLKPISNDAITYQISQMTTISDAIGYCYQISGHEFYVLTFPTEGKTFSYDIKAKLWHERNSYVGSSYTRELSNCQCFAYNKNLVGDFQSGKIYYLDENNYTENNVAIQRQLITPPAYAEGKKLFVDRLQVDTETGIGSNLTMDLDVSYDSGHSYTNSLTGTIPSSGGRMFWTRLGMTQNAFVLRLTTTINAKIILLGATAEARTGLH